MSRHEDGKTEIPAADPRAPTDGNHVPDNQDRPPAEEILAAGGAKPAEVPATPAEAGTPPSSPHAEPAEGGTPTSPSPELSASPEDCLRDELKALLSLHQHDAQLSDSVRTQTELLHELTDGVTLLTARSEELGRLREYDTEIIARLHAENTRLRQGELTEAMAPLLRGLLRLHDKMGSLAAGDRDSIAGLLQAQLEQTLDVTAGIRPFSPSVGEPFDSARHTGMHRVQTTDPGADNMIARVLKAGFLRDQSMVRTAEVDVFRLAH
jgi:molecular chaperone GrpE (heat shock protein)